MRSPLDISTTTPKQPILSAAEAVTWVGLPPNVVDFDADLDLIIAAVGDYIQDSTGQRVFPETWVFQRDCLPAQTNPLPIPIVPVTAIDAMTYRNADGIATAVDGRLHGSQRQVILPLVGEHWPTDQAIPLESNVQITLSVGYVTVPNWAKVAARNLVFHWFDQRSGVQEKPFTEVPHSLKALLRKYRIPDHFEHYR